MNNFIWKKLYHSLMPTECIRKSSNVFTPQNFQLTKGRAIPSVLETVYGDEYHFNAMNMMLVCFALIYLMEHQLLMRYLKPKFNQFVNFNHNYIFRIPKHFYSPFLFIYNNFLVHLWYEVFRSTKLYGFVTEPPTTTMLVKGIVN